MPSRKPATQLLTLGLVLSIALIGCKTDRCRQCQPGTAVVVGPTYDHGSNQGEYTPVGEYPIPAVPNGGHSRPPVPAPAPAAETAPNAPRALLPPPAVQFGPSLPRATQTTGSQDYFPRGIAKRHAGRTTAENVPVESSGRLVPTAADKGSVNPLRKIRAPKFLQPVGRGLKNAYRSIKRRMPGTKKAAFTPRAVSSSKIRLLKPLPSGRKLRPSGPVRGEPLPLTAVVSGTASSPASESGFARLAAHRDARVAARRETRTVDSAQSNPQASPAPNRGADAIALPQAEAAQPVEQPASTVPGPLLIAP